MKSKLKKIYFYFVKKIFDLMYGRLIPSNDIHNINYKTELVSFNHNNQKKFKIYKISNSRI